MKDFLCNMVKSPTHTSMSKPMFLFPSWCAEYILEMSSLPFTPEFSASARGKASKASANFLMAYCSRPGQDCREGERNKKRSCFCNLSVRQNQEERHFSRSLVHFSVCTQICIPLHMRWAVWPARSRWLRLRAPVVCPTDGEWHRHCSCCAHKTANEA